MLVCFAGSSCSTLDRGFCSLRNWASSTSWLYIEWPWTASYSPQNMLNSDENKVLDLALVGWFDGLRILGINLVCPDEIWVKNWTRWPEIVVELGDGHMYYANVREGEMWWMRGCGAGGRGLMTIFSVVMWNVSRVDVVIWII